MFENKKQLLNKNYQNLKRFYLLQVRMWPPIRESMKDSSDIGSDLPEQEQELEQV